jgi:hypothetical protein
VMHIRGCLPPNGKHEEVRSLELEGLGTFLVLFQLVGIMTKASLRGVPQYLTFFRSRPSCRR